MDTKKLTADQIRIQELEKELESYNKAELDRKIVKAGEERGLTFQCNNQEFKVKAFVYLAEDGLYRVKADFEALPVFGSKKLDDAFEALQKDFNFGLSQLDFVAEDNKPLALTALRERVSSKLNSLHSTGLKKPQTTKSFEYLIKRFNEGVKIPLTEPKTETK